MTLTLLRLQGTPREMGRQHGEQLRGSITELARERTAIAIDAARDHGVIVNEQDCLDLAELHLPYHREYAPRIFEELAGIAEGANMTIPAVFLANALTDFKDVLWQTAGAQVHGCTSFAVRRDASIDDKTYIGQTWDMHASAERFLTVFHRAPDEGPESLTLSTAGCLSLIGVNSEGIAIGNNNLIPTDARLGVMYLAMIHRALSRTKLESALRCITDAERSSGHNYLLADDGGAVRNIETTACRHVTTVPEKPFYVHTNHYLAEELKPLQDPQCDTSSSEHRLQRLSELFAAEQRVGLTDLQRLLSDREGGEELCICRHGEGRDARSCAFVVVDPEGRRLHVKPGPPALSGELQAFAL